MRPAHCKALLSLAMLLLLAVTAQAQTNSSGTVCFNADPPYTVGSGWMTFTTSDTQAGPFGGLGGTTAPINNEAFTFTLTENGQLKVTDIFLAGDYLRVWDNGVLLGTTPRVVVDPTQTTVSPDVAYGDTFWSWGSWVLKPGAHSLQFQNLYLNDPAHLASYSPADHAFRVDTIPCPEPGSVAFFLPALGLALATLRRRR
ncbi:MAG TPA: hypothetical protein VGN26_20280 [Armatimonadota bacterium]|jgi:hypothetical protein